ncbi:MAG: AAA family ATPase [Chromatiales bacterium]|nr:AAA family ATPase [Chromatiales bacterium]
MRETCDWALWSRELARKIAEGGEQYLIDKAKSVAWQGDDGESSKTFRLLRYRDENIDPLSFFYTLASEGDLSKTKNPDRISRMYRSVVETFDMAQEPAFDHRFIFPTPPRLNSLFHKHGEGNPRLIWKLFREAVQGIESVKPDHFERALEVGNVATPKLTQALFLVNPEEFLPFDERATPLKIFESDALPKDWKKCISWKHYRQWLDEVNASFPGCWLCEANLLAWWLSSGQVSVQASSFYQISTNVHDDDTDRWDEFDANHCVYTGGPGQERAYPLAEPKPGDVILVRFGQTGGRGIGMVHRNDYQDGFEEDRRLHVVWLNKTPAALSGSTPRIGFSHAGEPTVAAFRQAPEYAPTFALLDRLRDRAAPDEGPFPDVNPANAEPSPGSAEKTASPTSRKAEPMPPFNRILFGPPGTGKTWRAATLAVSIADGEAEREEVDPDRFNDLRFDPRSGDGQIAMVTFHQNFAYEDFIEGIRPVLKNGRLAYKLRAGIFRRIAKAAKKSSDKRFVLIIDEINRGNIAKIFGELITLIEDSRRVGQPDETWITLPYSGKTFGVPDNLYIVGTMNTADRSIQLLDTALRRRFTFIEAMPNPKHHLISSDIAGVDCQEMLTAMNERIAALLDREHQIGHTYLLEVDEMRKLSDTFRNRMLPLLQEYFFDDWAKIGVVLGNNAFVTGKKVDIRPADRESMDEDRFVYKRLPDADPRWEDPGEYRKIYDGEIGREPEDA